MSERDTKNTDGLAFAKALKFNLQFHDRNIVSPIPFERISAVGFFNENKEEFTKAAAVLSHVGVDFVEYTAFLTTILKVNRYNAAEAAVDSSNIKKFIERKLIKIKKSKIFSFFKKSAEFVSQQAAQLGYITTIDYLRSLIASRKLVNYYVGGQISKYYLAAIPKFPQLVDKLDSISRDEFMPICNKYEKYQTDVRESMKQENAKVVGVFSYTDSLISKKREALLSNEIDIDIPPSVYENYVDPNS